MNDNGVYYQESMPGRIPYFWQKFSRLQCYQFSFENESFTILKFRNYKTVIIHSQNVLEVSTYYKWSTAKRGSSCIIQNDSRSNKLPYSVSKARIYWIHKKIVIIIQEVTFWAKFPLEIQRWTLWRLIFYLNVLLFSEKWRECRSCNLSIDSHNSHNSSMAMLIGIPISAQTGINWGH